MGIRRGSARVRARTAAAPVIHADGAGVAALKAPCSRDRYICCRIALLSIIAFRRPPSFGFQHPSNHPPILPSYRIVSLPTTTTRLLVFCHHHHHHHPYSIVPRRTSFTSMRIYSFWFAIRVPPPVFLQLSVPPACHLLESCQLETHENHDTTTHRTRGSVNATNTVSLTEAPSIYSYYTTDCYWASSVCCNITYAVWGCNVDVWVASTMRQKI